MIKDQGQNRPIKHSISDKLLSNDMIISQLERMISSVTFRRKKQLCHFLKYIVETELAGNEQGLKGNSIAAEVFGKRSDTGSSSIVRTRASQLRKIINYYYETEGVNDRIKISIPAGKYRPKYQLQLNNLVLPQRHSAKIEKKFAAIGVVSFQNLSDRNDYAYFCTGLTQGTISALTNYENLAVIGPLLLDKENDYSDDKFTILGEHHASFLLDGAVQVHDEKLRVRVNLLEYERGTNVWSGNFQYSLNSSNWFEIEDDIVSQIVSTVADNFGVIPQALSQKPSDHPIGNNDAYTAVLKFYHATYEPTPEATQNAMEALETACRVNPEHVTVLAMYADMLCQVYFFGSFYETLLLRAERFVRKAINLNPSHQHSHWVLGFIHFLRFQDEPCIKEIEKSVSLNPNHASLLGASAYLLSMVGQWDRGLYLAKRAIGLNPHYPGWFHFVFFLKYYRQGDYESALTEAYQIDIPGFYINPLCIAVTLGQLGQSEKAVEPLGDLLKLIPDFIESGKDQLRTLVFSDEHVEMLWEGLQKAGIYID